MLTKENIGDLVFGDLNKLPGTAKSVISLLNNYEIDVKGKNASGN
jgi:5,10-methylene-tetrahydrofolate dehydrogenase/methenyl tetrahydrofolate cyclohydrolase